MRIVASGVIKAMSQPCIGDTVELNCWSYEVPLTWSEVAQSGERAEISVVEAKKI